MTTKELKVSRIGNSRGVRLPAASLRRFRIGAAVIMEERSEGIFLRPAGPAVEKLSWEGTAGEMATCREDWSDWDAADADGMETISWDRGKAGGITEKKARYRRRSKLSQETIKRYEIRWVSLDPARGAEMAKKRPAVIVSLDVLNEKLETVTVCPLTSRLHPSWRCRLLIRRRRQEMEIAADQIRTVSKFRLGARIDALTEDEAAALRRIITEMYGE